MIFRIKKRSGPTEYQLASAAANMLVDLRRRCRAIMIAHIESKKHAMPIATTSLPLDIRGAYRRLGLGVCFECGRLARGAGCLDRRCPNHDGTRATISWPWGQPYE